MRRQQEEPSDLEPVQQRRGNVAAGEKATFYYLYQSKENGSFWEVRPLYDKEQMYYSGGPVEYIEVDTDYVKKHYGDDILS